MAQLDGQSMWITLWFPNHQVAAQQLQALVLMEDAQVDETLVLDPAPAFRADHGRHGLKLAPPRARVNVSR